MDRVKRAIIRFRGPFFIALILTLVSYNLVNLPWIFEGEENMITFPTKLKKILNRDYFPNYFYDTSYIKNNFLIINTTTDQELTFDDSPFKGKVPGTPIVDRRKLYKLFMQLYKDTAMYNHIICDQLFSLRSSVKSEDDTLEQWIDTLRALHKIIFGNIYDVNTADYIRSIMNVKPKDEGAVNTESVADYYLKHRLTYNQGGIQSLPQLMYTTKKGLKIEPGFTDNLVVYKKNGEKSTVYNTFIPEILFNREDFNSLYGIDPEGKTAQVYDSSTAVCNLGKIVEDSYGTMLMSLLYKTNNKKDIFIGSISGRHADMHQTLYGNLDGPILIINTFYCIELGYNKFSLFYIGFSFLYFFGISCLLFYYKKEESKRAKNEGLESAKKNKLSHFIRHQIGERMIFFILLSLLTVLSYFQFKHTTNVIALLILLEVLHPVIRWSLRHKVVKKEDIEAAE